MNNIRPNSLLMVRPYHFTYNPETAIDNAYMNPATDADVASKAQAEFDGMVGILESHNINTTIVQDTPLPPTPDSLFPNNWASYHHDGTVLLYPMYAKNRRAETAKQVLPTIMDRFHVSAIHDFRHYADENQFLEGTGSIIFDHENKVAYAGYSRRTNKELFEKVCALLHYDAVGFDAVDTNNHPIYHTNVMMNLGENYAVTCLESISDDTEKKRVLQTLTANRENIIPITQQQVGDFAGNMIQAYSGNGDPYTLLSARAYGTLLPWQRRRIQVNSNLLPIPVPTIEKIGGGSVRCMVSEIGLQPKTST